MGDQFVRYVINLADREDRRKDIHLQLKRVGWNAEYSNSVRPETAAGFPSIGAHGCFMSHLATLRRGASSGNHIILMEDDLNFAADFAQRWDQTVNELESIDWSIFYPAHYLKDQSSGLTLITPTMSMMCAHFIIIHKNAVPTVIRGLEEILSRPPGAPSGGPMHVDGAYSVIRAQNPRLDTYVLNPSLGHQRPSRSDVANAKFYDRTPVLRPVMSALRRFKQRVVLKSTNKYVD
jgi:glycosyl transferase, family 25